MSAGYVRRKISRESSNGSRAVIAKVASEYLRKIRAEQSRSTERPGLVDYVAGLVPEWDRFDYFAPYAAELENAIGGNLRICFAAPPQHGKTEFTLRGLLYICRYHAGLRHAYVTYNNTQTQTVAKNFQDIAREAGAKVGGTLDIVEIDFGDGKISRIKFTSIEGGLTGWPIDGLCVVDDAIKDREAARSAKVRQRCIDWWKSVARVRRHPGTSYIVMATRWPGGDLTEHLTTKEGFKYINLKAVATGPVNDNGRVADDPLLRQPGETLWVRKPIEFFREDMADLFWWSSMFQGEPRVEGIALFAKPGSQDEFGNAIGPRFYRELPRDGYRVAFGVDLAYTAKTSADWSICIEGWEYENKLYLVNVHRKQVDAPSFLLTLISCKANRPGAHFRFYASGTEKGSAQFIQQKIGRTFRVLNASADKLVRATPASVTWNQGRILLPDPAHIEAPWLDDFLAVVCLFTGTPGAQDDDADALAALHDELLVRNRMYELLTGANKQ